MSKPVNILQQANPALKEADSAPQLHSLQTSEGKLSRTSGSLGAFVAGGPLLSSKSVVSAALPAEAVLLTPDQVVGCEIHITDSLAGAGLQFPAPADIVRYLGQRSAVPSQVYAAGAIVNAGVIDAGTIATPSVYLPSFDFSIVLPQALYATRPEMLANGQTVFRDAGLGIASTLSPYTGLLGGGVGQCYENRFRGYVLNATTGSEAVAIVHLNGVQA